MDDVLSGGGQPHCPNCQTVLRTRTSGLYWSGWDIDIIDMTKPQAALSAVLRD